MSPFQVTRFFRLLCSFLCFLNHRSYTINSFNQINPFLPWLNKHIMTHAHAHPHTSASTHTHTHTHAHAHPCVHAHTHSRFPLVSMPVDIRSREFFSSSPFNGFQKFSNQGGESLPNNFQGGVRK